MNCILINQSIFLSQFSNQSARELSQFAESAMAVKRVIMQHFSMKYDYMNKERPNVYHPSRAGIRDDEDDTLLSSSSSSASSSTSSSSSTPTVTTTTTPTTITSTAIISDNTKIIINHIDTDNDNANDGMGFSRMSTVEENSESQLSSNEDSSSLTNDENDKSFGEKRKFSSNNNNNKLEHQQSISSEEEDVNSVPSQVKFNRHPQMQQATAVALARKQFSLNGLDSILEMKEKLPSDFSTTTRVSAPHKIPHTAINRDSTSKNCKYMHHTPSNNYQINHKKPMAMSQRGNIRPEENWRYRNNTSNSMEYSHPFGFKNYRNYNHSNGKNYNNPCHNNINLPANNNGALNNFNNYGKGNNNYSYNNINSNNTNNNSYNHYLNGVQNNSHQYQSFGKKRGNNEHATGIDMRNWRNECMYTSARNCGMSEGTGLVTQTSTDSSDSDATMGIGLSPPSESLLMQRRMQMHNRASEIGMRTPPPATASG